MANEYQEEKVAHLITLMETYFEGLRASNRQDFARPDEDSDEVDGLIAAYDARREKLASLDLRKFDVAPSLLESAKAVRERVESLATTGWASKRVATTGAKRPGRRSSTKRKPAQY